MQVAIYWLDPSIDFKLMYSVTSSNLTAAYTDLVCVQAIALTASSTAALDSTRSLMCYKYSAK